jgi:hypothetical protein
MLNQDDSNEAKRSPQSVHKEFFSFDTVYEHAHQQIRSIAMENKA